MDEITVQAPAKLNLTLDVLGRRADGYHDLKMVMQSITLADRLTLRPGQVPGIQVSSSFHFLPTGEKNLAGKAAVCFSQALAAPPVTWTSPSPNTCPCAPEWPGAAATPPPSFGP